MKDQNESLCHIGFVFVELGRSFLVFFFPEVDVDLAGLDNFTGVVGSGLSRGTAGMPMITGVIVRIASDTSLP